MQYIFEKTTIDIKLQIIQDRLMGKINDLLHKDLILKEENLYQYISI